MKISYAQVEEFCNEMHRTANNIREILEDTKNQVNLLSGSDVWEGQSANYYLDKFNQLSSNFEMVYQELESAVLYMAACSDGYQKIDENIMNEICNNLNIERIEI